MMIALAGFGMLFFHPLIGIALIAYAAIVMPTISAIKWHKDNKDE